MRIKESLNVRFDKSPPPKSSPLVDDDIIESRIIEKQIEEIKDKENGPLNQDIVNIKESKERPLETVIGKLNERTLRFYVQNQSNFFYFVSSVEPKNIKESIKDESWTMAMQEELNQFVTNDVWSLVLPPINQIVIGNMDHVKELMEGTEMTKQESESMLYDEFDKFTSEPGESIRSY
ncbi:hypothetical protein Tco_1217423 [Tanacetum coccineum]